MAKVLFLDDRTKRIEDARKKFAKDDLTIVTNVLECLRALSKEEFGYVYLDHDLGGLDFVDPDSQECGMEIVRYIQKTGWPPEKRKPTIIIHSSNAFAAYLMMLHLESLGFFVVRRPYQYEP